MLWLFVPGVDKPVPLNIKLICEYFESRVSVGFGHLIAPTANVTPLPTANAN
jgi:hypothetical protein